MNGDLVDEDFCLVLVDRRFTLAGGSQSNPHGCDCQGWFQVRVYLESTMVKYDLYKNGQIIYLVMDFLEV